MELKDFVIGGAFWTEGGAFRCTDIGTRVVVAIELGPRAVTRAERAEKIDNEQQYTTRTDDLSSLNGPPYAVEEIVFDEYDLPACFRTEAEAREDPTGT